MIMILRQSVEWVGNQNVDEMYRRIEVDDAKIIHRGDVIDGKQWGEPHRYMVKEVLVNYQREKYEVEVEIDSQKPVKKNNYINRMFRYGWEMNYPIS